MKAIFVAALLVLPLPLALADPAPEPDLVVLDVTWQETTLAGEPCLLFSAVVENQGDATAGSSSLEWSMDGQPFDDRQTPGLEPGASATVSGSCWDAVPGDHVLTARADALSEWDESDETNNERSESFTTPPARPDLVVDHIFWNEPATGPCVRFDAVVQNLGEARAEASILAWIVDGQEFDRSNVSGLEPGEATGTTSACWDGAPGDHTVTARADAPGDVDESDEANNEGSAPLTYVPSPPPAQPDLVVNSVYPEEPGTYPCFRLVAVVQNSGEAPAEASTLVWLVDGQEIGRASTPGLAPHEATGVRSPCWEGSPGGHVATAHADALEEISESDETNNERSEGFTYTPPPPPPQPDLVVANVSWTERSNGTGPCLQFTAVLQNAGEASAGASILAWHVDGEGFDHERAPGLEPGASATILSPCWDSVPGNHTVTAQADALAEVDESDEANNERSASFTRPSPRDPAFVRACAGRACVTIVPVAKLADLGLPAARPSLLPEITVEVGALRVDAAGTYATQAIPMARVAGFADGSALAKDFGFAQLTYASQRSIATFTQGVTPGGPKVGELWSARLIVTYDGLLISDDPVAWVKA